MNEDGKIKEFADMADAKKEGYKYELTKDERDKLEQLPDNIRKEKLMQFRNHKRLQEALEAQKNGKPKCDPKFTKKKKKKPTKKKKEMVKKSKKGNRKKK